jgi:hypothetical protein
MKKYLNSEGNEIKIGTPIVCKVLNTETGRRTMELVVATEEVLEKAVADGALTVVNSTEGGTHLSIEFYVEHLADRIGWKMSNLVKYLDNLYKIYPTAVFQILLREVAIVLDQKYPDHIERSKEIWCISLATGEIGKVPENKRHLIRNFRNFAAFRTLDDAMAAKHILKVPMKELFARPKKSGKQKD